VVLRKSFTLDVIGWLLLLLTKSKIPRNSDSSNDTRAKVKLENK